MSVITVNSSAEFSTSKTLTFVSSAASLANASLSILSAPPGDGCVGAPILPQEVAGTSSTPSRSAAFAANHFRQSSAR
ncbi:hypothetical protein [Comamonas sp. B-9]|uniref:hypothetical protein n=1 Tax=Comamonas sp. B-9 TaxID=1055192 RepID=UPI0011DDC33D|nr:hypothetical protein [Comamonas sp. B-9]